MPFTIVSSNTRSVDAAGSGRVFDFMQNGYLWFAAVESDTIYFYYSTDSGVNWTESVASRLVTGGAFNSLAFYIDKDNNAHVVYVNGSSKTMYAHGVASSDLTSFNWVQPGLNIAGGSQNNEQSDVVAHREGSGWVAHVVTCEYNTGVTAVEVYWTKIVIDAAHSTSPTTTSIKNFGSLATARAAVDFRHTEADPKEVQSGTPSVYVVYHAPGIPTNLFFKKIAYSAGVWTPGTERTIDAVSQQNSFSTSLVYDGTRVMMTAVKSASNTVIRVWERDEADTTTTARDPTALADGALQSVSIGLGKNGDVWLVARGGTSLDVKRIRFTRATVTWDAAWVLVEADNATSEFDICIGRGMKESLGCVYRLLSATPDQARFAILFSAHEAAALLQGVGSTSGDAALGFFAQATLQGVATIAPTLNGVLAPTATLQGVATLGATGLYVPALDFTTYDGYIVDPVNDSFIPMIYHDSPETPKRLGSIKLRPPRQDTGLEPTEVRPETGETFSQQDFSHGAGQLYYHHEGRDVRKFLWSEGYELDIDTVGQPAILRHLRDVPAAAVTSADIGQLEVFNDLPFAIAGTKVKVGDGLFPGTWTDEDPSGAEADVTVNRIVSSGEFLYAALGSGGIHRRDTAGAWAHWSNVLATRVAWLKNRIIASNGVSIYEVVSGGAAPAALETLPAGWSFERAFEAGGFIYAVAINVSSSLSRIHTYGLNDAGSALEKKSETPFPRNQIIRSGRGYLGAVYLGGGIRTSGGGYDPVVYQAFPQDDGSLTYAKIAEGEGAGAQDLSVLEFEPIGEDVLFGWSLGSGFPYGSRDGLAVHKLKTGAFLSHLKKTGAGGGRQVVGLVSYRGRTLFSLKGDGVYFEDPSHFVADAYIISSVADWQTTARKSWDLFQVSHSLHPAGSTIAADFTTRIPSEGIWTPLGLIELADEEVHEVRIPELEGRLLAVRIRSTATSDKTGAPEAIGFLVRSNLLPDNPEFGLQRTVRVLDEDSKDGGETVWPKGGVDAVRRVLHLLAHRWVTLHEPGVTWSVRVDDVQEVEPSGPIFRETEGEAPRQGYLIQLALAGTRD